MASLERMADTAGWEPKYPFDLVVVYEDRVTRSRALHLYDHLAQQLLDDYDFQCSWWKCDHLQDAALLEQAAEAATNANMIVVSVRAGQDLIPPMKQWIDKWLPRRNARLGALVALFGADKARSSDDTQTRAYLQRIARRVHLDFFAHSFELESPAPRFDASGLWERERRVTPLLEEILRYHPPTFRWGINE